jgi:hypothetical protein
MRQQPNDGRRSQFAGSRLALAAMTAVTGELALALWIGWLACAALQAADRVVIADQWSVELAVHER